SGRTALLPLREATSPVERNRSAQARRTRFALVGLVGPADETEVQTDDRHGHRDPSDGQPDSGQLHDPHLENLNSGSRLARPDIVPRPTVRANSSRVVPGDRLGLDQPTRLQNGMSESSSSPLNPSGRA